MGAPSSKTIYDDLPLMGVGETKVTIGSISRMRRAEPEWLGACGLVGGTDDEAEE